MKKIILYIFIIVAVIQLAIPIHMIASREYVLRTGTIYKLKTRPVDPYDAFRGRYVALDYEIEEAISDYVQKKLFKKLKKEKTIFIIPKKEDKAFDKDDVYVRGEVHVSLVKDPRGFARVDTVSIEAPDHDNYITVTVKGSKTMAVYLKINRFYMDEFEAQEAENVYLDINRKEGQKAHVEVAVKNGTAVIRDLYFNNIPVRKYLKKEKKAVEKMNQY